MGCKYIYLDADGKPSAIYEQALKKYGPEKAEELYLRDLIAKIDTRFSKEPDVTIEERAERVGISEDEKYYVDKETGEFYDRVTDILEKFTKEKAPERSILSNFKPSEEGRDSFEIAKEVLAKQLLATTLTPEEQLIPDIIEKKIAANPGLLVAAKIDIENLWEAQRKAGDDFHLVMSEIINQWEAEQDKRPSLLDIADLGPIIGKAKEVLKDKGTWPLRDDTDTAVFDDRSLSIAARNFFDFVIAESKRLKKRIYLKSEKKVFTKNLKVPGSPASGIGGSIDVLLTTDDKMYSKTADFKTKASYKAKDFDKPSTRVITGPVAPGIVDTARNRAVVQQSTYGAILNQPEYGYFVDEAVTFVIPLNFSHKELGEELGKRTYVVSNIGEFKKDIHGPFRDDIATNADAVLSFFKEGELTKTFEDARKTGIAAVTERWSGTDDNGAPNATWSKDHRAASVKKAMLNRFRDTKNNLVVGMWGETINVEGLSDDKIKSELEALYDRKKEDQINIANDLIKRFNYPDGPIPKTLENRSASVAAALKGITKDTHQLFLAQNFSKELRGIGPDVLVARNKTTGAITLISAVTTSLNKVSFQSEGGKKKRSSLLGAYKTDAELTSGLLSQELMTEPTTHDFISMKLGLAALYIAKHQKTPLAIEDMRVVSMGYEGSVYVTPTNLDEEITKLKAFEEYAGTDFPAEYSELLKTAKDPEYIGADAKFLENLMLQIANNTDPLGPGRAKFKKELYEKYLEYNEGKLVGFELRQMLGKYLQAVAQKLQYSIGDNTRILSDPRFVAVSKAFHEFMGFQNDLGKLAAERNSIAAINGAVSSGDAIQIRLHVLYNEASQRIRNEMDAHFKEHNPKLKALMKAKGAEWIGNTTKMFENLYRQSNDPQDRMMLKDENDTSLTKEERDYIKFFNDSVIEGLLKTTPEKYHAGIKNGTLWHRGTVPTIWGEEALLKAENFTSWTKLKKTVSSLWRQNTKDTQKNVKSFLEFKFPTRFDSQATDESIGHSKTRRDMLGLSDPNSPTDPKPNIEKNLALILNMLHLEGAEKANYECLLQSLVASHSVLASKDDRSKTNMTTEMIDMWREMVIFNRYKDEGKLNEIADPLNKISSQVLFNYSVRQAMIEASTGTLQTASSFLANSVLNAFAKFNGKPENAGRYTMADFAWGVRAWDAAFDLSGNGEKIRTMVWDAGMLVGDADNIRGAELEGKNKVDVFKSDAGFYLNRLFFNSAITHTFLAQMHHKGIDKAYVKRDGKWTYDETLDPRFYAYDPEHGIGSTAPITDDEKQRFSLWQAVRKTMDNEGMLDENKRMTGPLTANERAEIKHYATRTYGSFNKDSIVHGEAWVLGRSMLRYKKWAMQKIANWNTPTVKNDMWGHWETVSDGNGGYTTQWVGDEFQGIIQTLNHIATELVHFRGLGHNLNQYQRENVSKLFADLTMMLIMLLTALPLLKDTTPEVDAVTGETRNVQGDFGKSTFGSSAYKAALNATSDLFFLTSLTGMGGPNSTQGGILSNVLPGFGTMGSLASKAYKATAELVKPDGDPGAQAVRLMNSTGLGRTGMILAEPFFK